MITLAPERWSSGKSDADLTASRTPPSSWGADAASDLEPNTRKGEPDGAVVTKLDLPADDAEVHRRVRAVLLYLAESTD